MNTEDSKVLSIQTNLKDVNSSAPVNADQQASNLKNVNQMSRDETLIKTSIVRFVKGAGAGLVAAGLLQPLQVVKTSMQITPVSTKKPVIVTPGPVAGETLKKTQSISF